MRIYFKYLALPIVILFCCSLSSMGQDGAAIFEESCVVCHKLGQRLVGPDLLGVNEKRNEEWLLEFIKSPQAMINSGDPDAVAIYEAYNRVLMTDQSFLSDDEIKAVLAYIREETKARGVQAKAEEKIGEKNEEVEAVVIEYTEEDIEQGLHLFSGEKRFINSGPSCISCHHINNNQLVSGGLLAKDLTNVFERMGDAGLTGILGAPPFPAMAVAYKNNELDSVEIVQLTAFLKHASNVGNNQEVKSGVDIFVVGGGGGLILLFLLITLYWKNRLKHSVKHDIYKRQIKSI